MDTQIYAMHGPVYRIMRTEYETPGGKKRWQLDGWAMHPEGMARVYACMDRDGTQHVVLMTTRDGAWIEGRETRPRSRWIRTSRGLCRVARQWLRSLP